jgi:hypothetical protein
MQLKLRRPRARLDWSRGGDFANARVRQEAGSCNWPATLRLIEAPVTLNYDSNHPRQTVFLQRKACEKPTLPVSSPDKRNSPVVSRWLE